MVTRSSLRREITFQGELFTISLPVPQAEVRTSQVASLPDSLEAAFQEVEDVTNFRAFTLIGGPSPHGGTFSVMKVQSGRSRSRAPGTDGSFESFLGDLYPALKQKWIQWLATTYSECG